MTISITFKQPPQCRMRLGRSGFTLVELLIVIAIIATLMSILGVTVMSMIGTAKVGATKATIVKVQGLLQQRIDAITRNKIDRANVSGLAASNFPGNLARAEAVLNKIRLREAFPQKWSEVPSNLIKSLPMGSPAIPMSPTPKYESAEVLHFLLTKANILGYPPEGEDVFSTAEVKDGNGNGWPELVDAWGQPLRFYRWPTRLVRGGPYAPTISSNATARLYIPSLPTSSSELMRDAEDQYQTLKVEPKPGYGIALSNVVYFESGGAPMGNPWRNLGVFHTPETFSLPLIVSGGGDQQIGLFEPSDLTNFGHLGAVATLSATYDDISNYNIRSGGK